MRPFWLEQVLEAWSCVPFEPLVRIVSGGYTGLWTSIMPKEQNPELDVLLIEADIRGAGASGRHRSVTRLCERPVRLLSAGADSLPRLIEGAQRHPPQGARRGSRPEHLDVRLTRFAAAGKADKG